MKINRRQFLRRSAVVAAGAAAVAVVGMPEGRPEPMAKWGASATDALIVGNEFDYLVSACWADEVAGGRGIEGHEFVQRGGRSFRVYSNIQSAVDAATDGQSVFVAPGTYHGTVTPKPDVAIKIIGSTIT